MSVNLSVQEERAADSVLTEHWDRKLPVSVENIARHMGAIVHDHFGSESGKFELVNGQAHIYVNRGEPIARQRFTVAHEIGHWALGHGDSFRDPAANFSSSASKYVERSANKFAACLLMPRAVVMDAAMHSGGGNVDDLARLFRVSSIAMEYRLKNLGLIS